MSRADKPCRCGAPVTYYRDFGRPCDERDVIRWKCGATSNYDAPGEPCPNRDERAARDETTQPPEAEDPEAMSQTTETEPTQEVVVYPEVSTLPAIKPLADAALEKLGLAVKVVERLKGYRQLVLSDLTDKKAATDLDEKRKEVKRFRVAWTNACKEGRADARAIADAWVKAEKTLVEDFEQIEGHLEKQVEAHTAELARLAKVAADALKAKIQARLDAMTAASIPADFVRASELSDEDWSDYLAKVIDAKAKLDAATVVADELTALGDECTPGEALQLDAEQIEHRLGVARKADHDRREAQRIKDEEAAAETARVEADRLKQVEADRLARVRLERGSLRLREMSLLGAPADLDALADLSDEAYAVALETAKQEKADREKKARDDADELERLRKASAPVISPEPVKPPTFEIVREPVLVVAPAVVEPAAPVTSAEVLAWFDGIRSAIQESPDNEPDTLAAIAKMLDVVREVEDAFLPF